MHCLREFSQYCLSIDQSCLPAHSQYGLLVLSGFSYTQCIYSDSVTCVCVCPQAILQVIPPQLQHTRLISTRRALRDTLQVKPCISSDRSCLHYPAVSLVHMSCDLFLLVPLFMQDTLQELPIRCPRHRRTEPLHRTRRPRAPTLRPCIPSEVPTLNKTSTLRWAVTHTVQPNQC